MGTCSNIFIAGCINTKPGIKEQAAKLQAKVNAVNDLIAQDPGLNHPGVDFAKRSNYYHERLNTLKAELNSLQYSNK